MLELGRPKRNEELRPLLEGQLEDVQEEFRLVCLEGIRHASLQEGARTRDEIREEARLRDYALKERVAARYNKKVMRITFLKNDLVLLRNDIRIPKPGEGKLTANWKDLFRIAEVLGKSYYKVAILQGADLARSRHACDLKKYNS
ncbi:hypothetical protein PIB30_031057 [Stylosanthes scabra]|uniref:Uncharacterized protein n=1 Tax=Stylosanthes scabra TaxID=79078 RepID=A0ABU6RBY9_9FABA|nr:hypothetical protein [Stylosanthes scabra]